MQKEPTTGIGIVVGLLVAVLLMVALIGMGFGTWVTLAGGSIGEAAGDGAAGLAAGSLAGLPYFIPGVIALGAATIVLALDAHGAKAHNDAVEVLAELRRNNAMLASVPLKDVRRVAS